MATFILDGGLDIVTNRIKGAGTEPLNIGWGTGAGTTTRTDTTLFTEALVTLAAGGTDHTAGTSSRQTTTTANDTYRVTGTRTATGAGTCSSRAISPASVSRLGTASPLRSTRSSITRNRA
jgi:hypothetical protein